MMKSTLTILALAALLVTSPAQEPGKEDPSARKQLEQLKKQLEDMRVREQELRDEIDRLRAGGPGRGADAGGASQAEKLRRLADEHRRALREGRAGKPRTGGTVDPAPRHRVDPFGGGDPFERHRRLMEEMRRRMDEVFGGRRDPFRGFGFDFDRDFDFDEDFDFDSRSSGQSMKVEAGPDGVRAEVRSKGEDGKWTTKVYEAESMEELRRKHPDVFGKSGGFELRFGGGDRGGIRRPGLGLLDPFDDFGVPSPFPPLGDRPALGVTVTDSDEGGLEVKEVAKGSLAEKLGVRPGDLIVEVNGQEIGTAAQVGPALLRGGDKVEVVVERDGAEKTLDADNPYQRRARPLRRSRDI